MRRFLNPFILTITLIVALAYSYAAYQLTPHLWGKALLALPFISVWLVPVLYWVGDQDDLKPWSHAFQYFAYLSMGWLNFLFFALISLNLLQLLLSLSPQSLAAASLKLYTPELTFGFSIIALGVGYWRAKSGPTLRLVNVPLKQLPRELSGLRIAQISDLHIGPTIHRSYVEHVVAKTNALQADLIVITGDLVDGTVAALRHDAAPLAGLRAKYGVYFILGNHDYYSGATAWTEELRSMGIKLLLNSHTIITVGQTPFLLAGVLDPAVQGFSRELRPDPAQAMGFPEHSQQMFCVLLAHNPKLAQEAARAGFHLQISGHTHAGQFIPWTWVVKWIHKPHYAGLSKEGDMVVYVSAGTGSWGPPLRLGTSPELTVLHLESH